MEEDIPDFDVAIVGAETELGIVLDDLISELAGITASTAESNNSPDSVAFMCDVVFFTSGQDVLRKLASMRESSMYSTRIWVYFASSSDSPCKEIERLDFSVVRIQADLGDMSVNPFSGLSVEMSTRHEPERTGWIWLVDFLKKAVGPTGNLVCRAA